jgi:predicted dehydrogenase
MYTQDKKFKLGIAGMGIGSSLGVPAISLVPEIQLVSVWGRSKVKVDELSASLGIEGFTDFDAFVNSSELDGVWLATPPSPRMDLMSKCLDANLHVFLEKPLGLNLSDIHNNLEKALAKNSICGVDFEYRAHPLFQEAKQLLETAWIGEPRSIHIRWMSGNRMDPAVPWGWYNSMGEGGGIVGAIATHHIDLCHWLFGPIESVQAMASTVIPERFDTQSSAVKVCDSPETAFINLRFKNGAIGSIAVSCVTFGGPPQAIEIYGDSGRIHLVSKNAKDAMRDFTLEALDVDGRQVTSEVPFSKIDSEQRNGLILPISILLKRWITGINNSSTMEPSFLDGLNVHNVVEAINKSLLSDEWISVNY